MSYPLVTKLVCLKILATAIVVHTQPFDQCLKSSVHKPDIFGVGNVNVCFWSSAVQAPLKLKAPRGAPTPINRNQANQPRSATALLGKRPFDSVRARLLSLHLSLSYSLSLFVLHILHL